MARLADEGDGEAVGAGFTDNVLLMSDSLTLARPSKKAEGQITNDELQMTNYK